MLTAQSKELLRNLRAGKLDASVAAFLEQLAADDFIADLRRYYPVLFQERNIGRKHEIGLARYVGLKSVRRGSIRNDECARAAEMPAHFQLRRFLERPRGAFVDPNCPARIARRRSHPGVEPWL